MIVFVVVVDMGNLPTYSTLGRTRDRCCCASGGCGFCQCTSEEVWVCFDSSVESVLDALLPVSCKYSSFIGTDFLVSIGFCRERRCDRGEVGIPFLLLELCVCIDDVGMLSLLIEGWLVTSAKVIVSMKSRSRWLSGEKRLFPTLRC